MQVKECSRKAKWSRKDRTSLQNQKGVNMALVYSHIECWDRDIEVPKYGTQEIIKSLTMKSSNFGLFCKDSENWMKDLSRGMAAYESQKFKGRQTG